MLKTTRTFFGALLVLTVLCAIGSIPASAIAVPPDATTEAATAIKATKANLNAIVNPLGSATTYWFEYGKTKSYGTKIPVSPESVGSGTSPVAVSQTPTNLIENTEYHFRVLAESEGVTSEGGADKTFTTPKLPDATTEAATAIKATKATLNGKVNPLGLATTYWFEYGKTKSYGTKIPVSPESVGSGTSPVEVSQIPTGLSEGTEYHFRIVAESEAGRRNGADKAFTTLKMPSVNTEAATSIKLTQATLNAIVNPEGSATTYWFEYGKTTSYGTKIPVSLESVGSGPSPVEVSQIPTGLSEGTEYHFRVVAESTAETGTRNGADKTFITPAPPDTTTEAATAIKATKATLNAKVNPLGSATSYWFEYGKTTSYGTKIPVSPESVGSGASNVGVKQTPTGLSEGTEYHFRVVAENEEGTIEGADKTFTTPKLPDATTEAASAIKATKATLNGKVNPLGSATSYWFEYGKTTSYGTKIPVSPESVGSGTSPVEVSQTPTGLSEGTEYHFRIVAESEAGMSEGGVDKTFTTLKLPALTTEAAAAVKLTQATLNAIVNPEGSATTYWFEYGKTTSYGTKIPVSPESVGSGTSPVEVSQTPTGLSEGTEYHFRIVAESEAGTTKGADKTFFTLAPPTATTEAATDVLATRATLNGKVNSLGSATSYWFEYGKTKSYGSKIPVSPESVGSGISKVPVSQTPTGLSDSTEYHFRIVAESTEGTAKGIDKTFTTLKLPDVTIKAPTAVKATKATLDAIVNPLGSATSYWFEYGKTTSYGTKIPVSPESVGSGTSPVEVSETPTGLSDSTEYHFRVVAESAAEAGITMNSADETFTTLKLPDATTEAATVVKATQATLNGIVTPLGFETSYWFEYGETTSYGTKTPVSPELIGSGSFPFSVSQTPTGLSEGTTYHFRVVAETEGEASNGADKTFTTTGPGFSFEFGNEGSGEGQFKHPAGISVDSKGNLWVVDMENARVEKFDTEGKYLFAFGETGSGKCQFSRPVSIAIDSVGDVWIADAGNNRVEEFDEEGKCIIEFGEYGLEKGQFNRPEGIAIDTKGNIWVADTYNGRLQEFDEGGKFIKMVGSQGSEPGQLLNPVGIDTGPGGNVWVAEWGNARVTELNEAGEFVQLFGKEGSGGGQFSTSDTIDVDESGNVWVVDEGNGRVERFDEEGKYLGKFGSKGSGEGQFSFYWPTGIASDAEGNLWVTDSLNNRVQKWIP